MGSSRRRELLLTVIICVTAIGGGCSEIRDGPLTETIEIQGERFTLEIALDDVSRIRGLQGRTTIPSDGGMLFVFPDAQARSFWMADCLVDIDLIFLDPRGRVTATHQMKVETPQGEDESRLAYQARLRGYFSVYPAQFAIELAAGSINRLDVRFEQRIELDLRRLKGLPQ